MKALKIIEPKRICITEEPDNFLLSVGQALVRVKRVSLCGSDFKLYNGQYSGPSIYPIIFGHEWAGEVVQVSENIKNIQKGDRVTGDCSNWCGECPCCFEDKNLCENIEKSGITKDGFARQLALVPVDYLYKIPEGITTDLAALTEPFAVALNGIKKINYQGDFSEKILILGAGPIGIAIYILLRFLYSFHNIDIYDPSTARIDVIKNVFPEINFINLDNLSIQDQTYQDFYKSAKYSYVFEAAGTIDSFRSALDLVKAGGSIVTLGMSSPGIVDIKKIVLKCIKVLGSIGGTGSFEEVLTFFKGFQQEVLKLVTHTFSFDEIEKAFSLDHKKANIIKIQIYL